ncbi:transposase [candidate division KSB1 bacterium]|nr:transposase [candidate division KSB1 bacterium]
MSKNKALQSAWMEKGRWMDNVFVERLWRSLKYEDVYLKAYDSVPQAKESINSWFHLYNNKERRHQSLRKKTPDTVYFHGLSLKNAYQLHPGPLTSFSAVSSGKRPAANPSGFLACSSRNSCSWPRTFSLLERPYI